MSAEAPERPVLDLQQAASLLGAYCAIERRLFELTGALAAEAESEPSARVALDAWSAEHAWHAELWADRLPVLSGVDARTLVEVPASLEGVFDKLLSGTQLEQLAGLFRLVLPRLVTSYSTHLELASKVSEGPTRRALRLVLRDETEAWVAGEALVEGLLGSPEEVASAGRAVVALESLLTGTGTGPGLVPWPARRG
jgi:hypothetical protein